MSTPDPRLIERVGAAYQDVFSGAPTLFAAAPGRINVLGGHTDYSGGLALPSAIDRWVVMAVGPALDKSWRVHSAGFGETIEIGPMPCQAPRWVPYVRGVAALLAQREFLASGFSAVFAGDVPLGGGLSSSAALEVATATALEALYGLELSKLDKARLCQQAENEYAGVPCGLLDQIASACALEHHWLLVDFAAASILPIPAQMDDCCWIAVDSDVQRELDTGGYRQRVEECREAAAALNLQQLSQAEPEAWQALARGPLRRRARHVFSENTRVRAGAEAVARRDYAAVGALMYASHQSLRDDHEVSCPELDYLVETAAGLPGWLGGRLLTAAQQSAPRRKSELHARAQNNAPQSDEYQLSRHPAEWHRTPPGWRAGKKKSRLGSSLDLGLVQAPIREKCGLDVGWAVPLG